jgi:DNA-binding transcriptional ArsR family regulator
MATSEELLDLLARRHAILRAVRDSPRRRHELVGEFKDAKSTVYKGITQLEDAGLIKRTDQGVRATLYGVAALQRYEELERTTALAQFLADLPPDAIDPAVFVGSELVAPATGTVDRHLSRARELLEMADTFRGVAPVASIRNIHLLQNQAASGQLTAEFVLSTELVDAVRDEDPDILSELSDRGVTLWQTNEHVPFGVYVMEHPEGTQAAVEFRDGELVTGLLINDTDKSISWAIEQFGRYKQNGIRI